MQSDKQPEHRSKPRDELNSTDVAPDWQKAEAWQKLESRLKRRPPLRWSLLSYPAAVVALVITVFYLKKSGPEPTIKDLAQRTQTQALGIDSISPASESRNAANQSVITNAVEEGVLVQNLNTTTAQAESLASRPQLA